MVAVAAAIISASHGSRILGGGDILINIFSLCMAGS